MSVENLSPGNCAKLKLIKKVICIIIALSSLHAQTHTTLVIIRAKKKTPMLGYHHCNFYKSKAFNIS